MTRQDGLSILITFVIGLVAGSYFYVTGFSFKTFTVATQDTYEDFAIVGESYGNCGLNDGCMSFQLIADGTYRALPDSQDVEEGVVKEGDITGSLRKELQKNINISALEKQSKKVSATNCASGAQGIDYGFRITLDGKDYLLDTCKTSVDYDSKAWNSLAKLWNHFETLK